MIKKRFISMLVLLCLTVSGAWAQAGTLLTTIVSEDYVDFTSGSKTFDNIATVTFSDLVNNDGDDWGWYAAPERTLTVTAAEGYTITRVKFYTMEGSAFDEEAPFEAILVDYIAKVNGNSIGQFGGVTKIEVYGYAGTPEPATVAVTGVTLAPTTATLTLGETETVTLIPTVLPGDATDKSVTWSSSNEAVATVADGVVTAVAAGEATITVTTTDGAKTATCAVTVAAPAASTYTVTLKEGTEDAASWTITPAEATTTGVAAGTEVKATYGGMKKVKSIKAVKKAKPAAPTLAATMTTAGMTVKVNYNYYNEENYCLFTSNGDGTYTFQSGSGFVGGDENAAKALVVEDGKLVFKQNFYDTIDGGWDRFGFSVTFDTSNNTYTQWAGVASQDAFSPSLTSVEVNGTQIAVTAAPAPAGTMLTLGAMSNGGDPFSGTSGSEAYSQTFAVGGQIAIIYKNTSNESVKVVTDALTAADISNEGMTATINVTIDDADKTQGVTYIYPAAMANDDGTINYDFTNQNGTVTAIYKGSGAWDGDALPSATMESQQAIVKFILKDNSDNLLDASSLTISAASNKLVASKGFIAKSQTYSGYTYDGGTTSSYDSPSNLVDGKKNYPYQYTKWCTSTGDKVDGIWYCEFHTESAVQVNGYTITTGHDNYTWNNRNPKDWVLKAKADAGDSWTTIATVTNDATLIDDNCKSFDFIVDVHGTYQYFRFEVSATRGADVMQMEELELFKSNYSTAYGDLTVTPASATSEIFVALRNENGSPDTYTVSAKVGEKMYAFSKSDVTFQNGNYYEITVKMAEQTASTVEWIFSEMTSEHADLYEGYTYKGVTLSGDGDLNFDHGSLYAMDGLTFTAPTGKHFKKIVITATGMADISGSGWTNDYGNGTSTWTGDASTVTIDAYSMADGVTSIVFTLE